MLTLEGEEITAVMAQNLLTEGNATEKWKKV